MEKKFVELDRLIYGYDGNYGNKEYLMLINHKEDDKPSLWEQMGKGNEHHLWYTIGDRGGLAEAKELFILKDEQALNLKIEEYIDLYRKSIQKAVPLEEMFNKFIIEVIAWRRKEIDDIYYAKEIPTNYEVKYKLIKTGEDDEKVYYSKEITDIEDMKTINNEDIEKYAKLMFMFTEK